MKPTKDFKWPTQTRAAWIFGSLGFAVVIWIVLFGPEKLSPSRHQALGFLCAVLSGLFGAFFTGNIRIIARGTVPKWGKVLIQAGGGGAFFAFVLLWWNSDFSPVSKTVDGVGKDIRSMEVNGFRSAASVRDSYGAGFSVEIL